MYADELPFREVRVAWGDLGTRGSLGYEDKRVAVQGVPFTRAISAHAPSRVVLEAAGRFHRFHARVAINDDVPRGRALAHFSLLADGREVATQHDVVSGDAPREIEADISGASRLELVTRTTIHDFCHSVWLDPIVDDSAVRAMPARWEDCLARMAFARPAVLPRARDCIASVVSPGWEPLLARMFESIRVHGQCDDALKVVFAIDPTPAVAEIARRYGVFVIPCERRSNVNATVKSVLYSVGLVVDADRFLCLDSDTMVLAPLPPLLDTLSVVPAGSILAVREANGTRPTTLRSAISTIYGGDARDLAWIMGSANGEADYSLVVNDGVFAGTRDALLTLDGTIRRWPFARAWTDARRDNWWRNQFIFNLALAHRRCGVELDGVYNVQLHFQDVRMHERADRVEAHWGGRPVRILHFNGWGRSKYTDWRDRLLEEGRA